MTSIHINLPDHLAHHLQSQGSPDDYIRRLLEEDLILYDTLEDQPSLHALLAISASQLDRGEFSALTAREIVAQRLAKHS